MRGLVTNAGAAVPAVLLANTVPAATVAAPVPPRAIESVPVQPSVSELAWSNAVAGVPPKVRVTLVSSVLVRAAPVTEITPLAVSGVGVTTIGAVAVMEVTVPLPPPRVVH
jgi:hypothetical protein